MSVLALLGLSLWLSVAVAGLGWLTAAALERTGGAAAPRERVGAAALFASAMPPLAMALFLLTPAPVRPIPAITGPMADAGFAFVGAPDFTPVAETFHVDGDQMVLTVLAAALLLAMVRLAVLARRGRRLGRILTGTTSASRPTLQAVAVVAKRLGVAVPEVRVCTTGSEALLTGLVRPVLILPSSLAEASDTPAVCAVIAHELAHLKRGDHRAIWLEEILLALLAFNLFLPFVRARRAAAREEACDALALDGADSETRRAYGRSLVEALRSRTDSPPTPALTFTGSSRSQAMRRLQSILIPPVAAGIVTKLTALGAGVVLLALAGAGTVAFASQRQASTAAKVEGAPSVAGKTRLTVEISQDMKPIILATGDVLRVTLVGEGDGERLSMATELPLADGERLPGQVFLDLDSRYFPSRMPGRAYALTAEIQRIDGKVAYASELTTLRLAPRSEGQVARMRPVLILQPAL